MKNHKINIFFNRQDPNKTELVEVYKGNDYIIELATKKDFPKFFYYETNADKNRFFKGSRRGHINAWRAIDLDQLDQVENSILYSLAKFPYLYKQLQTDKCLHSPIVVYNNIPINGGGRLTVAPFILDLQIDLLHIFDHPQQNSNLIPISNCKILQDCMINSSYWQSNFSQDHQWILAVDKKRNVITELDCIIPTPNQEFIFYSGDKSITQNYKLITSLVSMLKSLPDDYDEELVMQRIIIDYQHLIPNI